MTVSNDNPGFATNRDRAPVVVVGAGLAGLVCAVILHQAGKAVEVYEAEDQPGGRTRSLRHPAGYLLDRGFQLVYEAYPAAQRRIDHASLRLRSFDSGVAVWTGKRLVPMSDPLRQPLGLIRDISSPVITLGDKARLARLALNLNRAHWQSARDAVEQIPGVTARDWLLEQGFSPRFTDRVARPYWGGVQYDPDLADSAGAMLFGVAMRLQGDIALPAEGMSALPNRLVRQLPPRTVRTRRRVEGLVRERGRLTGVLVGGELRSASAVVVATDPYTARDLIGDDPGGRREIPFGGATVYFGSEHRGPDIHRLIIDGSGRGAINHLAVVSAVQPAYAPKGKHLLAAVVLKPDILTFDDDRLAALVQTEAAAMVRQPVEHWDVVAVVRTPRARFRVDGARGRDELPAAASDEGLFLASDVTVDSTYNGAILSGETAARAVLRDIALRRGESAPNIEQNGS